MLLPNWHKRLNVSYTNRAARRRRGKFQPKVQPLEPRVLLTVNPTGVTITPTETTQFTGTVASFTSTETLSIDFLATITWGDGTVSPGTVTSNGSGGFNVTGTHTYLEDGSDTISVVIQDQFDESTATATSTALVAEATTGEGAFTASDGGTITAIEGQALSAVQVATFVDTESSDESEFNALIDWGDGRTTNGTVSGGEGNFTVTGDHTYADELNGTYTVTISEPEAKFTASPVSNSVTVAEGDSGTVTPTTFSTTEGQAFTGAVGAFTDNYTGQVAGDFTAAIDWGDGKTTTGTVTGGSGAFTVSGNHTYADEGTFTVLASFADDFPGIASGTITSAATVAEGDSGNRVPATISATEGHAFSGSVGGFTDNYTGQVAGDFTAAIDWGDGTITTGTITGGSGTFTISGGHTYAQDGAYTILASFADNAPSTLAATITSKANVAEADLTLTPATSTFATTEGTLFSGVVATISDPGTDPAGDYSATIDWGDGTVTSGVMTGSNGSYLVDGGHFYRDEGAYTITVTATETSAVPIATATAIATATVAEGDSGNLIPATIASTEGQTFSGAVGTFTDTGNPGQVAGDFTSSINWGDGTTSTGTLIRGDGTFTISGNHTYADEGTFTILASFTDDAPGTLSATITSTAVVSEADTLVAGAAVTASSTEGTTFSGTLATFTDTTYASNLPTDFTANIDWGDGTTTAGSVSGSAGSFTVSGSHSYAEEGQKTATIVLSDNAPGTATATATASIHVADATLSATGTTIASQEFATFSGAVASLTDADPNGTATDYTATIDWGDGSTSADTIAAAVGGFNVNGAHAYAEDGTYTIKVTIADIGGSTAAASSTAVITEPSIAATPVPINGFERSALTNIPLATFTHGDGSEPASGFAVAINWGDGTSSLGSIAKSGTTYTVSGSHTYLDEGTFPVTVHIVDDMITATVVSVAKINEELLPNGSEGSANQRFIQEIYRDLLHRAADADGLAFWTSFLDQGESRFQVVSSIIAGSMHGELGADLVTGMFEKYLGRDPDPIGLAFWVGIISQKETIEQTESNIVGTPEFFALAGSTNDGFITRLFELALGRAPDANAMRSFNAFLGSGMSREQTAEIVFNSHEFHQDEIVGYFQSPTDTNSPTVNVPFIDDLDFLDRPADPGGLRGFTAALDSGVLDQVIWADMMSSDEFFAKTA